MEDVTKMRSQDASPFRASGSKSRPRIWWLCANCSFIIKSSGRCSNTSLRAVGRYLAQQQYSLLEQIMQVLLFECATNLGMPTCNEGTAGHETSQGAEAYKYDC